MKTSSFRLKLFLVLLAFAIIVTFSITFVDYKRLNEQAILDSENQIEQATEMVLYALKTVDKALHYMDVDTEVRMEESTAQLQEKYEDNPNFDSWDFEEISETINMDIFIIDDSNKIIHSNVNDEIGLDFSKCCASLNEILHERRASGELFIDDMDIDQNTGDVKKYSYMATNDKKYIIELGYNLKNNELFDEFNFLTVAKEVVDSFSLIEGINVLNFGGLAFGTDESADLLSEHREAFERARDQLEIVEHESTYLGEPAIYRYVPYVSMYDAKNDVSNIKVIEVIYNQHQVDHLLQSNKETFLLQLLIVLIVTIFVSLLISSWFSKPMYLAFHDHLTGLKNRAAFDNYLDMVLNEKKGNAAILMMDLDNFKLVNDYLGHDKGDYLLQVVAKSIDETVRNGYDAFRIGGDEFSVIMENADEREAIALAQKIIEQINTSIEDEKEIKMLSLTVSIGIAISAEDDNPDDLYKKADIALYMSKEKGKNQYQVYSSEQEQHTSFFHT